MQLLQQRLNEALEGRKKRGELRRLPEDYSRRASNKTAANRGDFASNDYLGFARSMSLHKRCLEVFSQAAREEHLELLGATGSRLLSGNRQSTLAFEEDLARTYGAEAALLFSSGYSLNVGLLPAVAGSGDCLLLDEFCHASLKNGASLSKAHTYYFRHNDTAHLADRLKRLQQKHPESLRFIVVESVYSMDGDLAPLAEIVALAEQFGAAVIVDEAHGIGTQGSRGEGLVQALGLEQRVFARIHAFGKAVGVHGAAVLGSKLLREYLVNFCHSFIYSTALSGFQVLALVEAHRCLWASADEVARLHRNCALLSQQLGVEQHSSPIFSVKFATTAILREAETALRQAGFGVFAIYSPTVRRGEERLRLNVHSFNTEEEIIEVARMITDYKGHS